VSYEVEATSDLMLPDGRPLGLINTTPIATGAIAKDPEMARLAREVGNWVEKARAGVVRRGGMFDRTMYNPPDSPYEQMRVARHAVTEDDVVGGVADATEALAFLGGLKWESEEADEADIFNQLSADLNLDAKIREMWRELFTTDQFVCAKLWGWKTYTVRGRTDKGNKRKRTVRIWAPTRLAVLDSAHVVPIGHGPLREDRLAWLSTAVELDTWARAYSGEVIDPLMTTFFTGAHVPNDDEKHQLVEWGVHADRLLAMNPAWVFRHCHNRPDYKKFPDLRLRNVFGLLDLKRQLMASDRAMLVGAANYILLIRKGTDVAPAQQEEIANLKENYNFLAKLPVIISDHRLEIDIIAPKLDFVLKKEAYDVLDARILARTLASFATPGGRAEGESFNDILAAALQSRRHMIKRTLELELSRAIVEHPKNEGVFKTKPSLVFTPRTVHVGVNQAHLQALLALRTQREMSRDTILEHLGLDQATEAQRMELEEAIYDDIFKTQIPFAATGAQPGQGQPEQETPNGTPESPAVSGRRGGRPVGGGESPQSPQATAKPRTRRGNSTREGE